MLEVGQSWAIGGVRGSAHIDQLCSIAVTVNACSVAQHCDCLLCSKALRMFSGTSRTSNDGDHVDYLHGGMRICFSALSQALKTQQRYSFSYSTGITIRV